MQVTAFWRGKGTWQASDPQEIESALDEALKAGYRHIDTAYMYTNEASIGEVLNKWLSSGKMEGEELFIVTKLPMIGMRKDRVERFLGRSLEALNLECVDLCLMHMPFGFQYFSDTGLLPIGDGRFALDVTTDLESIWRVMEEQVECGGTKSIGISNFSHKQVERMLKASKIQPADIRVELHAYFQQKPLREFCAKHNITVCAFAPFASPGRKALYEKRRVKFESIGLLEDPVVNKIAESKNKTPAQILLRFLAQQDIVVIPKSTNAERLKKNLEIFDFELSDDEMGMLETLDKGSEGKTFTSQSFPGVTQHPEFQGKEAF